MNKSWIKRRYTDTRLGGTVVSPVIQMINFVGIAFLWINHIIPIEVFGILFALAGFSLMSVVGGRFRRYQASTDYDLVYEKQIAQAKVNLEIMLTQLAIMEKLNIIPSKDFEDTMKYLEKIKRGKT